MKHKFDRMELMESPTRDVNDAIVQMFFVGKWRAHLDTIGF